MIEYCDGRPSADLLRLQSVLSGMAAKVLDFCEDHGVPVVFIGGTALGAVREGGFIAWDDDIDLAFLREDYRRFARFFREQGIPGLVLQDWDSDPAYHHGFARIRLEGTRIDEPDFAGTGMHEGIFIDLFLYDELPRSDLVRSLQRVVLGLANLVIMPPAIDEKLAARGKPRGLSRGIGLALRRAGLAPAAIRLREKVSRWGEGSASGLVDSFPMLGVSHYRKTTLAKSDLLPPHAARLGTLEGYVPANAEKFFELHYNDRWREPPPEEARQPGHVTTVDFGD